MEEGINSDMLTVVFT